MTGMFKDLIKKQGPGLGAVLGLLVLTLALLPACSGGSNQKKDPALIAESKRLASHGSYWYKRGCFSRAERYFFQAMKTSRLLDDLPGILRARNNLGATALAKGRYKEAGEHLHKALELNQSVKSQAEQSLILGNLAGLAYKVNRLSEAERFWREAAALAEGDAGRTGLALHLNNLGMLLRKQNRLDEAETILGRAQTLAVTNEQTQTLAASHVQLGLLSQARGDMIAAENHLKAALEMDKKLENPLGIAQDLERLGLLFQQRRMWTEAARELDRAIYLNAALGQGEKVRRIYELLKKNQIRGGPPKSLDPYKKLLGVDYNPSESILCQ